jgi:hypothetical protein
VKTIPPKLLEAAVERLNAAFQPEPIYWFGLHAWGHRTEGCDALVKTRVEFDRYCRLQASIQHPILKRGANLWLMPRPNCPPRVNPRDSKTLEVNLE